MSTSTTIDVWAPPRVSAVEVALFVRPAASEGLTMLFACLSMCCVVLSVGI